MWKYASLLLAGAAIAAIALFARANPSNDSPAHTASPASAWELKDLDGRTISSSQYAGKVVILDFWATWCPPCRAEIPGFVELQKAYGDRGLVVVGVSLDQGGAGPVREFMRRFGMNYPVVMGDEVVARAFGGVEAVPTTFIIDRHGRLVATHVGYTEKEEFERAIKPLL